MQSEFAYDNSCYYSNQKTFIIPVADSYLLAVLNSGVMKFIFDTTLPKLRGGFFEPSYAFMKDVPIRRVNFTFIPDQRAYYLEKAQNLYENCLSKACKPIVFGFEKHHLS